MLMFPLDMDELAEAFRQDPNGFVQFIAAMQPILTGDQAENFKRAVIEECVAEDATDAFDALSEFAVDVFNEGQGE